MLNYSTNYFQRLTLESWYTNLEQTPLNRCQQLPAPYKRLIHDQNETDNGLLTDRLNSTDQKTDNLTNNRWIETHQWLMTNFTRVFQPIPSWLNWLNAITFNGPHLFSKLSAPTIAFLAFWLAKNSDYEPIVRVLRHMENSAPSSLSGRFVKLWK